MAYNKTYGSNKIPIRTAITIIDRMLRKGWVSYLDMNVALNEYALTHMCTHGHPGFRDEDKSDLIDPDHYKMNREKYLRDVMAGGGVYTNTIKGSYFRQMAEIWTTVHTGGPLEQYKPEILLEKETITRNGLNKFMESQRHISEDTELYLRNCVKYLTVFRYNKPGYSIIDDMEFYYRKSSVHAQNQLRKEAKIVPNPEYITQYELASDVELVLDYRKGLELKAARDRLIETKRIIIEQKRNTISQLMKTQSSGWAREVTKLYLQIFGVGLGYVDLETTYVDFVCFIRQLLIESENDAHTRMEIETGNNGQEP